MELKSGISIELPEGYEGFNRTFMELKFAVRELWRWAVIQF